MTAPIKPTIQLSDFDKLDVRVGTIVSVEDIPESDKLVKLTVDLGEEVHRTILVGMKKERQDPRAEIQGKQALFILNLPYKTMMGIESQGMLFDIGYADKITPVLAIPENRVPNGTRVG